MPVGKQEQLMLWRATMQARWSAKSVHALPVLVVVLLCGAALQAPSNVTSIHTMSMLGDQRAALQATSNVVLIRTMPMLEMLLLWRARLKAVLNANSALTLTVPGVLLLWPA
jgi:hypothetical protein